MIYFQQKKHGNKNPSKSSRKRRFEQRNRFYKQNKLYTSNAKALRNREGKNNQRSTTSHRRNFWKNIWIDEKLARKTGLEAEENHTKLTRTSCERHHNSRPKGDTHEGS